MKIFKYSVSHKEVPGKEWLVTFGHPKNKNQVIKKFETLYRLPFGNDPKDYVVKEVRYSQNPLSKVKQ